jgi:2-haloacid dehalogenase
MATRALIFDIGGTVFDWHTAIVEAMKNAYSAEARATIDLGSFAYSCRDKFLSLNTAVMKGQRPWMTSDQMLSAVMTKMRTEHGLPESGKAVLDQAWRSMPAWPGAREGIAELRKKYIAAPLTILSWPMAVGSSRRNGIEWDSILSCDVLGIYKPDPRCFARAAEIIDCTPQELMMVAVHPSDLRAAQKCGYRAAYVLPRLEDPGEDYTDTGFASEFDVIAKDFPDLARQLVDV